MQNELDGICRGDPQSSAIGDPWGIDEWRTKDPLVSLLTSACSLSLQLRLDDVQRTCRDAGDETTTSASFEGRVSIRARTSDQRR